MQSGTSGKRSYAGPSARLESRAPAVVRFKAPRGSCAASRFAVPYKRGLSSLRGCGRPSRQPCSRLVVAEGAADTVVRVTEFVLRDLHRAVVRRQHQVLLEDTGPELPARRRLEASAEVLEALVGLVRVDNQARRLHAPGVAIGIVEQEDRR